MNKLVLKLAVPSILANITIPLVGLVDTAIVGHISDASAIGGIAVGTMLFDLLYWNFGFLRVGTSGMTAQAYGREHETGVYHGCADLLRQSLVIAALATLLIWALQWFFVTAVLACVPCSAEVAHFARHYFFIRIWAAPATLGLMALKGWFIGMQDTISPMLTDIVVNVVNMIASYGLAVYTPLGAIGVAYGTVIAQMTGLALAALILLTRYRHIVLPVPSYGCRQLIREAVHSDLVTLNANLFIRSLCFMVVYVGFTSLASQYGDTELAISSIIMKLFMVFSYFIDGFAFAGEALVGRYIGELSVSGKEHGKRLLNRCVWVLLVWSVGLGVVFSLMYWWGGEGCIRLMTNDVDVLAAAHPYMGWLIAMPVASALPFIWDGIFIGATAGREIRNVMIWAAVGFVAAYVALYSLLGMQALYTAYFMHLAARILYLTIKWPSVFKKIIA